VTDPQEIREAFAGIGRAIGHMTASVMAWADQITRRMRELTATLSRPLPDLRRAERPVDRERRLHVQRWIRARDRRLLRRRTA